MCAYSCVQASRTLRVEIYQFRLKAHCSLGCNEHFVMRLHLQVRPVALYEYNTREELILNAYFTVALPLMSAHSQHVFNELPGQRVYVFLKWRSTKQAFPKTAILLFHQSEFKVPFMTEATSSSAETPHGPRQPSKALANRRQNVFRLLVKSSCSTLFLGPPFDLVFKYITTSDSQDFKVDFDPSDSGFPLH